MTLMLLLLPGLPSGPVRFVPVLPVIHHLDHGRAGLRRDLDQVHPSRLSALPGFVDGDDPDLLAIVLDQPNGADANLVVDAGSLVADFPYLRWSLVSSAF